MTIPSLRPPPPNAGKGRPKGSKNKDHLGLEEKLRALGCDPLEGLVKIAHLAMADVEADERELMRSLKAMKFDPESAEEIKKEWQAFMAKNHQIKQGNMNLALACYKELSNYIYPKKKSIDVTNTMVGNVVFNITSAIPGEPGSQAKLINGKATNGEGEELGND